MEVIAGVASVAQLIRYAITLIAAISDHHQQIEGRPALLRQRIWQLQCLDNTVESVSKNSSLGTPIIREHINIIIARVQYLTALLEKEITQQNKGLARKYLRAWLGVSKEQKILDTFNDLESGKSALLLSIAEAHTEISSNIHNAILQGWQTHRGKMSSDPRCQVQGSSRNRTRSSGEASAIPIVRSPTSVDPPALGSKYQEEGAMSNNHNPGSSGLDQNPVSVPRDDGRVDHREIPQESNSATGRRRALPNNITGSHYASIEVGNNSRTVNGNIGPTEGSNNFYEKIKMGDHGQNVNGNSSSGANLKASGIWDKQN